MSKKHETVVMDLEKYVSEMKLKGLVQRKKHDYACMCPFCYRRHKQQGVSNYSKLKLWIHEDYRYGRCFVCNTVFVTPDSDTIKYGVKSIEPDFNMSEWKLCKLGEDGFFKLSLYNSMDEDDPIGVDYLAHRIYLYRKMYKLLGIKFHRHNPVIPFYYKGELIYYQIRIINPGDGPKYHSPQITYKPPYVLEHGDNHKIVICEGVFDAIACRILFPDRTPFAVLGSDLTDYQLCMLRSYCPDDILIYMDKTELSQKIKDKIEYYIDYANISINNSTGQDPEEYLKEHLFENLERDN
jgi:hypothetical protein